MAEYNNLRDATATADSATIVEAEAQGLKPEEKSVLATVEAELAVVKTSLAAKEAEMMAFSAGLSAREAELAAVKSDLSVREAELVTVKAELEAKEAELTARVEEVNREDGDNLEKDIEIQRLLQLLEEKEAELVAKTGQLARLSISSKLGKLSLKEQNSCLADCYKCVGSFRFQILSTRFCFMQVFSIQQYV
jgi:hypothetical protein